MTENDDKRFLAARYAGLSKINGARPDDAGIGTLRERTLHSVLKFWVQPDEQYHEISLGLGKIIADVFDGEQVTEIQTGSFSSLNKKLERILPHYPVTVIYPVAKIKRLVWIDPLSGESAEPRKSPKRGSLWDVFDELVYISPHLANPRLTVQVLLLDIEEYRLRCGWGRDGKKGSRRIDRVPLALCDIVNLNGTQAYFDLLPEELESPFTCPGLAKALGLSRRKISKIVYCMNKSEIIIQSGKKGNAYLYVRSGMSGVTVT